ncbi:MAG: hypothetical protein GKR91_07350 [Pseudomonadales bacterium]|nr:hypothetical protein [Pseudomonadales bacterium]
MSINYTRARKIMHWLLAVLILFWLFVSGNFVSSAEGEQKGMILMFHSGGAIVILGLMLFRYSLRRKSPVPPMEALKPWEKVWSVRLHLSFYFMIGLMVLSGILQGIFFEQEVRVFGLINITVGHNESMQAIFNNVHWLIANLIKLAIAIHVLAAIKHQFIDKQPFIKRMV